MLSFFAAPCIFRQFGLVVLTAHLLLFIACLPPFQQGTWIQTEPAMLTLFALGSISALWLGIGLARGWLQATHQHRLLLHILLAWGVWQVVCLLWVPSPVRHWLGAPHSGEGGAWHVALPVLVMHASALWGHRPYRTFLTWVSGVSLASMVGLHIWSHWVAGAAVVDDSENPLAPGKWPDYLAFAAGWWWLVAQQAHTRRTALNRLAPAALVLVALFVSDSRAAQVLLGGALIVSLCAPKFFSQRALTRFARKAGRPLLLVALLLPFLWVFVALHGEWFPDKDDSLSIRAMLIEMSVNSFAENPTRLLTGAGWDSTTNDSMRYALTEGVHAFDNGTYAPNSRWLTGDHFHPHHQPLAALLAGGIVALLLHYAIPLLTALSLRRAFWSCAPMLVGLTLLSHLWFALPPLLAFQSLALAALLPRSQHMRPATSRNTRAALLFSVVALIGLLAAAQLQYQAIAYGNRLDHITQEIPTEQSAAWLATDAPRGNERLLSGAQYHMNSIAERATAGTATEQDVAWYSTFLEALYNIANGPYGDGRIAMIHLRFSLLPLMLPEKNVLDILHAPLIAQLPGYVVRFSALAPQREDVSAPFFMNIDGFTGGDAAAKKVMLEEILTINPSHRTARWLLGSLYEADSERKEEGHALKAAAIADGVERVFPISLEEAERYREQSQP
jgi:hypothetical protein